MKRHAYIEGHRDPVLEKLSPAMWAMLFEAQSLGSVPYDAKRLSTRRVLRDEGFLTREAPTTLTPRGRRALLVEWRDPKTGAVNHRPD